MIDPQVERAFLAGDREAFAEVVGAVHPRVYRFLCGWAGDEATAEDLTQEVFRRAFEKRASFERRAGLSTWIFAIALNLARTHKKGVARRKEDSGAALDELPDPRRQRRSLLSSIVRREQAEILLGRVHQLPPSLREAFLLRHVDDMEYADMEKLTGVSSDTLYVRCNRARTLLRSSAGDVVDSAWVEKGR